MPPRLRPLLLAAMLTGLTGRPAALPQGQLQPVVDLLVTDAAGNPVRDLAPSDLVLSIDGTPRRVTAVRHLFRGPGAETAAARAVMAAGTADPAAEPSRSIVIAVDEQAFPRGGERPVLRIVSALLDRLGGADQLAFARLPLAQELRLSSDRASLRDQVAAVVGRAERTEVLAVLRDDATREAALSDNEDPRRERPETAGSAAAQAANPVVAGSEAIQPLDREQAPAAALLGLIDRLRGLPGPKELLLLGGTLALKGDDRGSSIAQVNQALDAAASARITVHVIHLGTRTAGLDLSPLAESTGGAAWKPGRNPDKDLARLGTELAERTLITFEPVPSDLDGRVHLIELGSRRPGLRLRAARRWVARPDPLPAPVARPASVEADGPSAPRSDLPDPEARRRDPELDLVMARASEYVASYFRDFSNIVAEEEYEQRQEMSGFRAGLRRTLKSDFLMVSRPGLEGWVPFRDVYEVDGKPVRDRVDRLRLLFIERPATALNDAREINDESARYNVGDITRNVNIPTFALLYLAPSRARGLAVARRGTDSIDGVAAWQVDFQERVRPTLIRAARDTDLPVSGSFWIEPLTGRVVKSVIRTGEPVAGEVTVSYRRSDTIGLWVPGEMRELFKRPTGNLSGRATYSNFRRFQVKTEETITVPKK